MRLLFIFSVCALLSGCEGKNSVDFNPNSKLLRTFLAPYEIKFHKGDDPSCKKHSEKFQCYRVNLERGIISIESSIDSPYWRLSASEIGPLIECRNEKISVVGWSESLKFIGLYVAERGSSNPQAPGIGSHYKVMIFFNDATKYSFVISSKKPFPNVVSKDDDKAKDVNLSFASFMEEYKIKSKDLDESLYPDAKQLEKIFKNLHRNETKDLEMFAEGLLAKAILIQ